MTHEKNPSLHGNQDQNGAIEFVLNEITRNLGVVGNLVIILHDNNSRSR